MSNPKPIVVVPEPVVSDVEHDTTMKLAAACLKTTRTVCKQEDLDLAVSCSALFIAAVQAGKDYGMTVDGMVTIVRELFADDTHKKSTGN